MRIVIVLALLAGCASKKASTTPANTAPAPAAEPRKESKESTDKDSAPADTKRKSDPCEGGQ